MSSRVAKALAYAFLKGRIKACVFRVAMHVALSINKKLSFCEPSFTLNLPNMYRLAIGLSANNNALLNFAKIS